MGILTIVTTAIIGYLTFGTGHYDMIESVSLTIIPSFCYMIEQTLSNQEIK